MKKRMDLLTEINIDNEFKKVVRKLSKSISEQITRSEWVLYDDDKNNHLNYAEALLSLIEDCYPDNQDYQTFIKFIKEDIVDHRKLIKKNAIDVQEINDDKPTFH